MQTSAEFWALASGSYRHAQDTLQVALQDKTWTAALEQTSGYESLPPAVILDLDETVLDNVPLEAQLVLDRTGSLQPRWGQWTSQGRAPLVAGAREFLAFAASRGVRAFFVTNRAAGEQHTTLKNLIDQGLSATDDTLMVVGENGWTSDKTARRAAVAKTHRILLLVGDDMNDFVSTAKLTPEQRVNLARTHAARWGQRWVLIPNPLYGSWERALYPGVTGDEEILEKKRELLKGIE